MNTTKATARKPAKANRLGTITPLPTNKEVMKLFKKFFKSIPPKVKTNSLKGKYTPLVHRAIHTSMPTQSA